MGVNPGIARTAENLAWREHPEHSQGINGYIRL